MERIESGAAIILKTRVLRELSPQLSKARFAFVENRSPKKGMTLDVQYNFWQTLRLLEKLVRLKTRNPGEGVNWIRLRQRNHIVRNGIDAKFPLVEILHQESITEFGEVSDAVDAFGKIRPVFQAEPIPSSGNTLSRHGRLIQLRILILQVIGFEFRPAFVVLPILDAGIKPDGQAATP